MQEWARRKYNSLIQTQIIEDGFQRERRSETTSAAKSFNEATAWYTLIRKEVIGKVHHFKMFAPLARPRGVQKTIKKKTVYKPSSAEPRGNLQRVMGHKSSDATWWTCTSSTWNKPFAHFILQGYCVEDKSWLNRIRSVQLCWL